MNDFFKGLVLFLVLVIVSATGVQKMSSDEFINYMNSKNNGLVMAKFYAPWCGFCQAIKGSFREAANEAGDAADFIEMDCSDPSNTETCNKYHVSGFPTMVLIDAGTGKSKRFSGERNKDSFVRFVRNADMIDQ